MIYTSLRLSISSFFFFNDTATTEIYTLSLHDALPIYVWVFDFEYLALVYLRPFQIKDLAKTGDAEKKWLGAEWGLKVYTDRKSTRLNSSHGYISYAVFCLKKKKNRYTTSTLRDGRSTA